MLSEVLQVVAEKQTLEEDTNLIAGFDAPEGSEKVTEDEFDPIPVLISKNSQGLQRDPALFPAVPLDLCKGPTASDGLALYKTQPEMKTQPSAESDYATRDGPSSNSSFYSSEGEGTDHEGDILDCSGSRPLLLDSEEEEESCRPGAGFLQAGPKERRDVSREQHPHTQAAEMPFPAFQSHSGEVFNEPDVFATAPFRSSRKAPDEADVFTKAPFISKGSVALRHPEEADVFLRAPFTKKKSMEELLSHSVPKEPLTFLSPAADVQHRTTPAFQSLDAVVSGPSARLQYPSGFALLANLAPSVRATDEHSPPADIQPELSERSPAQPGPQECMLGPVANSRPFRPQALSKYSRHYSPEDGPGLDVQPIAAYKVVSQTNRQAIAGSVSLAPLAARTTELPAADPFASAPFPSKAAKQKP
uniref:BMP-2-inducible protein kinase C-terminal domain-containing protein n=1 Tax=Meleagris gallopavo TaxID=9103 RepID=G1NRB7_MELGA